MSKSKPTPKSSAAADPVNSQVNQEDAPQDESLEEILLQELLQKTTDLQQAERKLFTVTRDRDISRHIVSCQSNGIIFVDSDHCIIYANTVFCSMTRRDMLSLKGQKLDQFITLPEPDLPLETILQKAADWESWHGQALLYGDNASQLPLLMTINHRKKDDESTVEGFVCQFSPAEEFAPTQSPMHSSSLFSHDALTGLPDRPSFQQHLSLCISQARAERAQVGLLYIDIDHFKRINRMLGPGFGDELLCSITGLLQQCAKAEDIKFIARLSGDEFAIIIPPPGDSKLAIKLAERILDTFQNPINIKSRDIFVTSSIGISLYPDDGKTPPELLRNADTAMEIVKARGGNSSCRWDSSMDNQAVQNIHLENDLRKAVANGELFNHYQPQIDLTTGTIIGMEALARWEHPEHGNISPVIFIPIAENTGLIEELGLDLVRLACEEGRSWLALGYKNFIMAVNLSGRLLRRHDLFEQIMDCLHSTGFPADHLEVEFTESVLIENMENTIELINKCREQGIKMAIDDFGTGYSSLSYLQRFAVDKIKIDRSFIMDITTNASDAAITMAIIAIAKKLNFEVLAEGVETEEQLFFLQENHCDSCQGFLFSKPITAAQMTNLLMRDSSVALKHRRIIDKFYSIKASDD